MKAQEREKMLYAAEHAVTHHVPKELQNPMLVLVRECVRLGMEIECPDGPGDVDAEGKIHPTTLVGSLTGKKHWSQCHQMKFIVFPEASDRPRWHGIPHAFTMKLELMHDPDLAKIEYEILRRANAKALADHVADELGKKVRGAQKTMELLLNSLCTSLELFDMARQAHQSAPLIQAAGDDLLANICKMLGDLPAELLGRTKFAASELFQIQESAQEPAGPEVN